MGTLLGFLCLCFTLWWSFSASHMVVLHYFTLAWGLYVFLVSASHYGGPSLLHIMVVLLCFTLAWGLYVFLISASHYGGPSLLHISMGTLLGFPCLCFTLGWIFLLLLFSFWGQEDMYTIVCSHMGLTGETESLRLNYYSVWKALAREWTVTQCLKKNQTKKSAGK